MAVEHFIRRRSKGRSGVQHVRVKHTRRFLVMTNDVPCQYGLSVTAIGMATYITSAPDGTPIGVKVLSERLEMSQQRAAEGLRELEYAGLLTRRRIRLENGQFAMDTHFSDVPGPRSRSVAELLRMLEARQGRYSAEHAERLARILARRASTPVEHAGHAGHAGRRSVPRPRTGVGVGDPASAIVPFVAGASAEARPAQNLPAEALPAGRGAADAADADDRAVVSGAADAASAVPAPAVPAPAVPTPALPAPDIPAPSVPAPDIPAPAASGHAHACPTDAGPTEAAPALVEVASAATGAAGETPVRPPAGGASAVLGSGVPAAPVPRPAVIDVPVADVPVADVPVIDVPVADVPVVAAPLADRAGIDRAAAPALDVSGTAPTTATAETTTATAAAKATDDTGVIQATAPSPTPASASPVCAPAHAATDHDGASGAGPSVPGTASVPGQRRSACRLPHFEPVTELDPASTSYAVLARLREIDRRLLFTRRDACALTPYVEEWLTRVPPGAVLMSLTLGLPQGPIHHPARLLMSRLVEAPMPGPASRRVLLEDDRPGPVRADDHDHSHSHSHDDSHGHHDRRCETRPLGGGDGDGPPDAHVAPAPARSHTRRLPFVNCPCCGCAVRGHVDMLCDMCLRARCDPEFHGGRSPGCPRAPMPLSPILHRPRRYPPRGLER